jgi:hypothetical protein
VNLEERLSYIPIQHKSIAMECPRVHIFCLEH